MVKYITGDELAAIIKSDQIPLKHYLVIDVRDDDYAGGNILKVQNWPSRRFERKVHELVENTKDINTVIFHCSFSQERGPKAARIYEETRNKMETEGANITQEVYVLQGGFTHFQKRFKDDPQLVENWDKETWETDWT